MDKEQPAISETEAYDKGIFPSNDDLYCPDCSGVKTRGGQEWHAWNCPRRGPIQGDTVRQFLEGE